MQERIHYQFSLFSGFSSQASKTTHAWHKNRFKSNKIHMYLPLTLLLVSSYFLCQKTCLFPFHAYVIIHNHRTERKQIFVLQDPFTKTS